MHAAQPRLHGVLVDLARQGLQRMGPASIAEIEAAAQVAHHARLTRIERELLALRTDTERYLARDPLFRTDAWIGRVGRLSLRLDALAVRLDAGEGPDDLVDLIGAPRRTYVPSDVALELQPLGMRGWVSDSDFVGVTTTFWCPTLERTVQASVARPTAYFGNDPARLAWQSVSDGIPRSMRELAHGAWSLEHGRVAHDGRLSLAGEAYVAPAASTGARALAPLHCADVLEVLERLRAAIDPLDPPEAPWVYLEPSHLGPCVHDDTHGIATVLGRDARGLPLRLRVRLAPHERTLARSMEQLNDPRVRPDGLVAIAYGDADGLSLVPVTAVFHTPVTQRLGRRSLASHFVHLGLEDLGQVER